jgi:hypothetical protein
MTTTTQPPTTEATVCPRWCDKHGDGDGDEVNTLGWDVLTAAGRAGAR